MTTIKLRRGTASEWTSANPVLADGEVGFERDTGKHKIGNGTSTWSQLDYFIPQVQIESKITTQTINAQTGTTFTPALGDVGKMVTLSNTGAITVTLPQDSSVAFPVGSRIDFLVINTGMATFAAGAGATLTGTPSLASRAQWSAVTAFKRSANTWVVIGDLA